MSRMLEALKALEARKPGVVAAPGESASGPVWHEPLLVAAESLAQPSVELSSPPALASIARKSICVACSLPTALEVADHYLDLAGRIAEQVSLNYCNVLLFVSPDQACDACFSLTHLAQAFALQSPGDVLLVDGDLRGRQLSKAIGTSGPGLGEVMLGTAIWPDVIHPTNVPSIDFVPCGNREVPTFERSSFGWNALRPGYRAVLIGVAPAAQPETAWLAARCDGVYLVLSRPQTRRQAAIASVNALRSCGANLLGSVVADN
jgi:Mrp family chromosome partitioning ATPase